MYLDRRWLHKNSSKFSCFTSPTESLYLLIYFWQKSLHICFSILCIAFQLTVSWRDWRQIHCCLLHSRCISTHSLTKRLTKRLYYQILEVKFQLTVSRRDWPAFDCQEEHKKWFQLTVSRRDWQQFIIILISKLQNFLLYFHNHHPFHS